MSQAGVASISDIIAIDLNAGTGITITQSGTSFTINAVGGGVTWNTVTGTSQTAAINNGYFANNSGLVTITLPATSAVGSEIEVVGINNATGWKIAQNAGNQIFFGNQSTTSGVTGFLSSTATYDTVRLICFTANANWVVVSTMGNITVH